MCLPSSSSHQGNGPALLQTRGRRRLGFPMRTAAARVSDENGGDKGLQRERRFFGLRGERRRQLGFPKSLPPKNPNFPNLTSTGAALAHTLVKISD